MNPASTAATKPTDVNEIQAAHVLHTCVACRGLNLHAQTILRISYTRY